MGLSVNEVALTEDAKNELESEEDMIKSLDNNTLRGIIYSLTMFKQ